jgi:hypothetical protein
MKRIVRLTETDLTNFMEKANKSDSFHNFLNTVMEHFTVVSGDDSEDFEDDEYEIEENSAKDQEIRLINL